MKIIIFHGTGGSPDGNWFPWLKNKLEKLGHEIYIPKLPTPDNQSVDSWCKAAQEQIPFLYDSDTILIGHSLGAVWVCESLSRERAEPVKASFLISGFLDDLGDEWFDSRNHEFTHYPFDWSLIKQYAGKVFVLHGDNDPYVSVEQAKKLAQKLGVEPIIVPNGGHLNAESGYTKFPQLLDIIKKTTEEECFFHRPTKNLMR
jgi:predicted alpha/beta hydrolase family esterase